MPFKRYIGGESEMMKKLFAEIPCIRGERLTLRALTAEDTDDLKELIGNDEVYRYLPTFLFEKKYDDPAVVTERLYDECLKDSLILGIFEGECFCGLTEVYGYRAPFLKVSVGYRLLQSCWGRGVATEALGLLVDHLLNETPIRIITASTMLENKASAKVLKKNGFKHVAHAVYEDWGYPKLIKTDKWIRTALAYRIEYRFRPAFEKAL